MDEQNTDRGQLIPGGSGAGKRAIALVVGLSVLALMAAFLLPVAMDGLYSDQTVELNQTTSTEYEVNSQLTSTVTAATAGADASIELNDTRTASTTSNTINVGENTTYSLEGGDVVVTVTEAETDYAVADYEYAKDYTYSDGAQGLWGIIGLAIILAVILFAIKQATDAM